MKRQFPCALIVVLTFSLTLAMPLYAAGPVEQQKLTASDATQNDFFGTSVSLSDNTIVVGANEHQVATQLFYGPGRAYVFERNGIVWVQQATLTAADAAFGDLFGQNVALDGATIVIGAFGDDDAGSFSGSAYVFERNGLVWAQVAKLTANDAAAADDFGVSIAINGDTIVVGARRSTGSGAAYVFQRIDGYWTQQAKLTASDGAFGDFFGYDVAISGDSIVVSARHDDDAGTDTGSVYVFQRTGTNWSQVAKLTAPDATAGDLFGHSVSISNDTITIGALFHPSVGFHSGAVYVFRFNGSSWSQEAKLAATDTTTGDRFGNVVVVKGETLAATATGDDGARGSAYVFRREGSTWVQVTKLTASDRALADVFGAGLSIEGNLVVVGAPRNDDDGTDSGSVYVYAPDPVIVAIEQLIATVISFNLKQGIENGLDAKLDAVIQALDGVNQNNDVAAFNMLNAFIQNVEAQRGNSLTDAQADQLIAEAQAIIDLLNS